MVFYLGLMVFSLNGLIFLGQYNQRKILEARLAEAIKQLNMIAISKGMR